VHNIFYTFKELNNYYLFGPHISSEKEREERRGEEREREERKRENKRKRKKRK
jgi:hypothetical protein